MLRIDKIEVYAGSHHILKSLSIEVGDKGLVAILGANGAGKSILFKTISGFFAPAKGTIEYEGKTINKADPSERVRLGICQVPEGRHVFPQMTVKENLEMGAFTRKDQKRIGQVLEQVYTFLPKLKAREKQRAGTMSGGEQQMLAIGRALMSEPRLLLMDEPSLGLSPVLVEALNNAITDIKSRGIAVLLSEQNAVMALNLADRAYVMELGSIIMEGSGQELLNNDQVRKAYLGL